MAGRPLRPCRNAGCSELTRDGWCDKHRPRHQRRVSEDYHAWYNLPVWKDSLRPAQLLREPFCRVCAQAYDAGDPRSRTRATVVDHIEPHRGDWAKFVEPSNLQSLCKRHHDQKTAREQLMQKRENWSASR